MNKFYITTPIFYTNGLPHVGHAFTSILTDALARYHRLNGEAVWFLSGTDEHGATNARAAEAAGKSPQDFVDEIAEKFRALKSALNLSWDDFIRTSDQERHWPGAQKLWLKLWEAGDLYRKQYRGLYCVGHESFITEKDLVGGKCAHHQKAPEIIEEENWFFRLSKYTGEIESRIKNNELLIVPESRRNEVLSLVATGLEDVSFSRPRKDLSWGIPVPNDAESTMYVWCDALANYLTAIGYGTAEEHFVKWWPAEVHILAKDILRFHAVIWPGMLLSAGLPLPKTLFVHGFITVDGQKMSKTIGNVIDPFELVEKYGTDPVRYYLLREIPSTEDGDFSHEKFKRRYNGDLANGLGNLTARVLTLAVKSKIKNQKSKIQIKSQKLAEALETSKTDYDRAIAEFQLHDALAAVWDLIHAGDAYINEERPWESEKPEVIETLLALLEEIARLLEPFLPVTAEELKKKIAALEPGESLFTRI